MVGKYLQLMRRLSLHLDKKTILLSPFSCGCFSAKASLYQSEEKLLLYYLSKQFGASIFKAIANDLLLGGAISCPVKIFPFICMGHGIAMATE